jgi:CheY-like chemotaxis protein
MRAEGGLVGVRLFATLRATDEGRGPAGYYLSGVALVASPEVGPGTETRELSFANFAVSAPPGATATIVRETREPADAPLALAARDGPPTVLVIEDDARIRMVTRRMLEAASYLVVEASGGRTAMARLREGMNVSFLVTDLKMEDGSGGWLLAQLAYEFPRLLSRTVVMTGGADDASTAHIATRWRCPVLAKPFTAAGLVEAMAALSAGEAEVA